MDCKVYQKIDNRQKVGGNLVLLKDFLDAVEIPFRLGYGTLLGVVRDNNFILGDNDVDLLVSKSYKQCFLENQKKLELMGFVFYRVTNNAITLVKDNVTFDCYFFSQQNLIDKVLDRVSCSFGVWCVIIDNFYWENSVPIIFLNRKFLIFDKHIEWLVQVYGAGWRVPQNVKGNTRTFTSKYLCKLKDWIKRNSGKNQEKLRNLYRKCFR